MDASSLTTVHTGYRSPQFLPEVLLLSHNPILAHVTFNPQALSGLPHRQFLRLSLVLALTAWRSTGQGFCRMSLCWNLPDVCLSPRPRAWVVSRSRPGGTRSTGLIPSMLTWGGRPGSCGSVFPLYRYCCLLPAAPASCWAPQGAAHAHRVRQECGFAELFISARLSNGIVCEIGISH